MWWRVLMVGWLVGAGPAIAQDDGGPPDIPEAEAMHAQLSAHFLAAEYDRALIVAQDLLQRRRRALGPGAATVTASLSDIATIRARLGDLEGAVDAYSEALALRTEALGDDHPDVGALYTLRSTAHYKLGRMDEAERDLHQAAERVPVGDRRYPFILQNLGGIALSRGHGDQATRLLERSLDLRIAHDGPEHAGTIRVAGMWAGAVLDHRPLVEGCAAADDVFRWFTERYGEDHPEVSTAWALKADCQRMRADLDGAEHSLKRAIAAAAKDNQGARQTYEGELAIVELLRGDLTAALTRTESALAALAPLEVEARFATLQGVHGRLLLAAQRPAEARDVLSQSRQTLYDRLGPDSVATLTTQKYLGAALVRLGEAEGEALLSDALARLRDRPGAARADAPWQEVGLLQLKTGDVAGALKTLTEGEQASIAYYGASNPATLLARVPRIEALVAVGRAGEARAPLRQSVSLFAAWQAQVQAGQGSREALALSALGRRLQDLALRVLSEPGDDAAAWSIVLALKGGARRSIDARASAEQRSAAANAQWERLADVRRAQARALLDGVDEADLDTDRDTLEEALAQAASQPVPPPPAPQALQAALPPRTVLIDLVVVGGDVPHLVGFAVTPEAVTRVDLGPLAPIERDVSRMISALQAGAFSKAAIDGVRARVGQRIVSPFESVIGKTRRVWVVPDGVVAQLPIAALPESDGRFLVERRVLRVLEDARDVLDRPPSIAATGALVIGGVDYGEGEGAACTPGPFSPIAGTTTEAQRAARALGTDVLSGDAPSFDRVRALLPRARVVHLATHGFYADRCETDNTVDALALSGVALAGANRGAQGVLTASDVLDLDLAGTELVVLSACQTGGGRVQVGEGVLGLRWALHRAGARSLVMAMYRVPDQPTVALMDRFYHHWKPGQDPALSLGKAQRDLIRQQRRAGRYQPGEWAGFVVSGRP